MEFDPMDDTRMLVNLLTASSSSSFFSYYYEFKRQLKVVFLGVFKFQYA